MDHPHIHCVVSGGGLSEDGRRWVPCRKRFFLPVRVLSALFKGKFLAYLKRSYEAGALAFPGIISHMTESRAFEAFRQPLYHKNWVVYCKPPFNGAKGVLQYLSRYTHRIAIGNHRLISAEDGRVSFRWRDYSDDNKEKIMTLEAAEFIRRFLLHILPSRFVKLRYYGLWGNRKRKVLIPLCRMLLGGSNTEPLKTAKSESWRELFLRLTGMDLSACPACQKGRMHHIRILRPWQCNRPPPRMRYA
jgi:hypothetical protein